MISTLARCATICVLAGVMSAGTGYRLPDTTKGVIDGKRAVIAIPVAIDATDVPLDPAGCEIHLVPEDDLSSELTYPCGEWFAPPPAGYQIWLEQGDAMTPFLLGLRYVGSEFKGNGLIGLTPVAPAGKVRLDATPVKRTANSLRLLSVDSHERYGTVKRRAFQRRVSLAQPEAVRLPVGSAIAGAFDEDGNAVAVSRPVTIRTGQTVDVSLSPPVEGSDILAVLERPRRATRERPDVVSLLLAGVGEEGGRSPDVVVDASDAVYAVWYGVDTPRATLLLESEALFHDPVHIGLRSGQVATVRSRLAVKPGLELSTLVPPSRLDEEVWTIRIENGGQVVRALEVTPNTSVRIESLPPEPLDVRLDVGPWQFSEEVDLSGGSDGRVEFVLDPLLVTGRVTKGEKPVKAEVRFSPRRDEYETATTDENGEYETLLWQARHYPVLVQLIDTPSAPLFEFVEVYDSRTLDFELPESMATLRIHDRKSGEPVPGAVVAFANIWDDPKIGRRKTGQRAESDAEGVAVSPPLRTGELQVSIAAEGYKPPEPIERQVSDDEAIELRVDLEPFDHGARLALKLASGKPAADAELVCFTSTDAFMPYWQGRADANGEVAIPDDLANQVLLVRHPEGAAAALVWTPGSSGRTVTLSDASPPLSLFVTRANGTAARHTELMCWIDGQRVSGPGLGFLTWSRFRTDGSGRWSGRGFPCAPLRLAAYADSIRSVVLAGNYDTLATTVHCPWPDVATIEAVE